MLTVVNKKLTTFLVSLLIVDCTHTSDHNMAVLLERLLHKIDKKIAISHETENFTMHMIMMHNRNNVINNEKCLILEYHDGSDDKLLINFAWH